MNEKKSADYKKLVADMQTKYPAYGTNFKSKLPGNKSIAGKASKETASEFCKSFDNVEEFYEILEEWGIDWQKNDEPKTKRMWAINAFANALEDGFDLNKVADENFLSPLPLWAPVVNKEIICQEINLYTYWQGFGYAKNTPKIKYLLVAQDWGNLFRRDPKDNQGFLKMNKTGEWIAPYSEIPKRNGTDTNLIKFFEILGYDLTKRHDDLFFTNFCLGYRSGNETGGMTKEILMNDSAEFKRLCEILEPENILCLGKITFEAVVEALTGDAININEKYGDFIDKNPFFPAECGEIESKIFPLAHCGVMGSFNRRFEKQLQDWERILIFNELGEESEIDEEDDDDDEIDEDEIKRTALYGAILGDIIGSPFEFSKVRQMSKDFELFSEESKFTDDTVMTIAIADAILRTNNSADGRVLFKNVAKAMRYYGKKYPRAGYGGSFREWLKSDNPKPYNSFGNGSAMRVSAAGWIFNSMFDTRECARMTARPTHNHPEGVKGAMAVASAIFLARNGATKDDIQNYIETEFDYDLSRSLDEIRPNYKFDETCQGSVPEAIIAFLESENFEDAIRNAVSLGGDTDTQAAIAGSIAEAFYGVPQNLIEKCREYLPQEFLSVIDKFNIGKGYLIDNLENDCLEKKIEEYNKNPSEKNFQIVKDEIVARLKNSDEFFSFFSILEWKGISQATCFEKGDMTCDILYSNFNEVLKSKYIGENFYMCIVDMSEVFRLFEEIFFDDEHYGLAINPYGENPLFLERNDLIEILDRVNSETYGEKKNSVEFTRKFLSNNLLTKNFFADVKFIHTSASGAMGDSGVFEVWTQNFEHYYCHWTDGFDIEKFHAAFMKDDDMPYFREPVKNGWCFHYMGCGNNFYIKEEFNAEYLRKFDEGLKNGNHYPHDEDVFPVEEIMLEILSETDSEEDYLKNLTSNMESGIGKFELPDNIVTYCRADISLLDYFEKNLKSDGIIYDSGFTTTTMLKIGSTENELEISIMVPKGIGHGAYTAMISAFPDECEFVLNRGSFFKVRKVDRENFQVVVEVIGRSPKELF